VKKKIRREKERKEERERKKERERREERFLQDLPFFVSFAAIPNFRGGKCGSSLRQESQKVQRKEANISTSKTLRRRRKKCREEQREEKGTKERL